MIREFDVEPETTAKESPARARENLREQADVVPAGWGRTQAVRRRVLDAQLARLAFRCGGTDVAARDAAARSLRLASRLERDELAW